MLRTITTAPTPTTLMAMQAAADTSVETLLPRLLTRGCRLAPPTEPMIPTGGGTEADHLVLPDPVTVGAGGTTTPTPGGVPTTAPTTSKPRLTMTALVTLATGTHVPLTGTVETDGTGRVPKRCRTPTPIGRRAGMEETEGVTLNRPGDTKVTTGTNSKTVGILGTTRLPAQRQLPGTAMDRTARCAVFSPLD